MGLTLRYPESGRGIDDLSSALDVETEHILWQQVFERGTTCLITSHRRAVLEKADQILMLEDGRITAQGKLEDLLKTNAEMQRLCAKDLSINNFALFSPAPSVETPG